MNLDLFDLLTITLAAVLLVIAALLAVQFNNSIDSYIAATNQRLLAIESNLDTMNERLDHIELKVFGKTVSREDTTNTRD